jgi:MurNAc alpha-1-phosphate uridylyltransferase
MLLAAGRGTQMRPLSELTALPLLKLGGRTLLDHALDHLAEAGVRRAVVNAHWHADHVARHLTLRHGQPETMLHREEVPLDTGGAVRAALDVLGAEPFFVVNGDSLWLEGPTPALGRLQRAWTDEADAVLLVQRTCMTRAGSGVGDFVLDPLGGVRRRREREVAPFVYAGVQLVAPRLFAGAPEGAFSMNLLWDRAIEAGRLRAVVHDGLWFHFATPADLAAAETALRVRRTGQSR